MDSNSPYTNSLGDVVYRIIFESDTKLGKLFDIILVISIIISVLIVILDRVASILAQWGKQLFILKWIFTILFSLEYATRVISMHKPSSYVFSFMGIIDLLTTLPSYIALFMTGSSYAMSLRLLLYYASSES